MKKRMDFELLRLIAIFGVVFNHTQLRGFELYMVEGSRVNYLGSLLLSVLCKVAVPLFFLVSGGLLLHRNEPLRVLLKKRVLRMAVVLVLFSGILYLFWCGWGVVTEPGVGDFLRRLWSTGVSVPYWYLYAYLSLLLLLPLLRPMVQHMSDRAFLYLTVLHLLRYPVLQVAGELLELGALHENFWLPMAEPNLYYFLMGYYLAHRFDWTRMGKKQLGLSWGLALLAVLGMMALAHIHFQRYGTGMDHLRTLAVFPVFAVYATVHQLCDRHPLKGRGAKVVETLGGCVFGTYLLEGVFRHYLEPVYLALEPKIHVLPACLVWVAAVVAAGLAVTWVLKKVPGLKKLL